MTLIRVGLANAKSAQVVNAPRFQTNWEMKSPYEIETMHKQVSQHLQNRPHGPKEVVRLFFGSEVADKLAETSQELFSPNPSPSKRQRIIQM